MRAHGLVRLGIGLLLFLAMVQVGYGQTKEYAIWTPSSNHIQVGLLGGSGGVSDAEKAANNSEDDYAIMTADRISIIAGRDSYLQLKFSANRIAGETTYIRISQPVLSGLNLSLTQILGLAGSNIIGEVFTGAGNNSNTNSSGVGTKVNTDVDTRMIVDATGSYYLAITPKTNVTYNSVRITMTYPSGLLQIGNLKMNVYHAFTLSGAVCSTDASFTSLGEATGVNLNLLNLSVLIANPHHAINNNPSNYASYSSGVLEVGVANTISQTIYFDHVASEHDAVKVRFGLNNSLIGLEIGKLDAINFVAYKGISETPVWTGGLEAMAQLLGLDLLNLINLGSTHKEMELTFKPGVEFDRIKIEYNEGLLGLGVIGDALRVYNVSLVPSMPEILETGQPEDLEVCEGETATFMVDATVPEGELNYQWQYLDGSNWVDISTEGTNASLVLTNVLLSDNGNKYRVLVTGGNAECLQTIASTEANLEVHPKPGKPHLTISNN